MSSACTINSVSAHPDCAAHDALQNRDASKTTAAPRSEFLAVPDQRRTACVPTAADYEALVYALALRRIRDTGRARPLCFLQTS